MERMKWFKSLLLLFVIALVVSCSKTASEPSDVTPSETYVLRLINKDSAKVGNVFVDNIQGDAKVRIQMDSGYYNGNPMSAKLMELNGATETVYANCNDINGTTGKSVTYPFYSLKDNSIIRYAPLVTSPNTTFRIYTSSGIMIAWSINPISVITN